MKVKSLLYFTCILLLIEISVRFYFYTAWNVPLFNKEEMLYHYYPELDGIKKKYYNDTSVVKVLILGGSAVTASLYCDLSFELRTLYREHQLDERSISIYNLARSGQTSFDSKIKRQYLADLKFDYTFIYDGFNDCRANNIPTENFDINYKHFTYYNEVILYQDYIKGHFSILPFTFNYIWITIKNKILSTPHVPPYYIVIGTKVLNADFWNNGKDVKTIQSFSKNLNDIYKIQLEIPDQQLILSTYAFYSPENYTLDNFYHKKLDYDEQKWPTEIYGEPRFIVNCVKDHNKILESWKDSSHVTVLQLDSIIPKNKLYYNDICHLTDSGCIIMGQQIFDIIQKDESISAPK